MGRTGTVVGQTINVGRRQNSWGTVDSCGEGTGTIGGQWIAVREGTGTIGRQTITVGEGTGMVGGQTITREERTGTIGRQSIADGKET